jgi:hypothetical protein
MARSSPDNAIPARPGRADHDRPAGRVRAWWRGAAVYHYASHPDPLAEAGNWFAITIGTHLPFWPLYVLWAAGRQASPTALLMPCAAVAALLFRRSERWLMIVLTLLPLAVWYALRDHAPTPLHRYGPAAAGQLFTLNAVSIGVLICLFGWFQVDIYRRMEQD